MQKRDCGVPVQVPSSVVVRAVVSSQNKEVDSMVAVVVVVVVAKDFLLGIGLAKCTDFDCGGRHLQCHQHFLAHTNCHHW